jgi:hypothetical protein
MEQEKKVAARTKEWYKAQENILRVWGEAAACYRFMNYRAFLMYKKSSMRFTLPVIILSTITGTANFAQEQFPESIRPMVPSIIGGMNLIAGLIATIMQFLKINELMESHRVASQSYGKLSRTIRLELALPLSERSMDGRDMVDLMRAEYDRLIEQSPPIPTPILDEFEKEFKNSKIFKPEIMHIQPIEPYKAILETSMKAKEIFSESKMKDDITRSMGGELRKRTGFKMPQLAPASNQGGLGKSVKEELEDLKKTGFVSLQSKVMQDFKAKTERMSGVELSEIVTEEPQVPVEETSVPVEDTPSEPVTEESPKED